MVAGRLTKAENKEMFFEPCFSCLLVSLSSSFAAEIIRIVRLIRRLHDAKLVLSLFGF
jgi:hypothetical protein